MCIFAKAEKHVRTLPNVNLFLYAMGERIYDMILLAADSIKSELQIIPKKIREVWRKIPSFPGYEASNLGRVRHRIVYFNVLKSRRNHQTLGGDTHALVSIGNRKRLVHRLVDEAFRGKITDGCIVHHKDNNMINNRLSNLKRVTYSQNTRYAYRDGRIGSHYKLNPFQRGKIVELYRTGKYLTKDLAEWFRVHKSTIAFVLREAGIKMNWRKKLSPAAYKEIRAKWIPYKYPVRVLAVEYKVSEGMIETILGMRASRPGKRLSSPIGAQNEQEKIG